MEENFRYWVTSPEVAAAAGLDLSTVEVLPDGSLNSVPRGYDLTMAKVAEGWEEPDPGTAEASGSSWKFVDQDGFTFYNNNKRQSLAEV